MRGPPGRAPGNDIMTAERVSAVGRDGPESRAVPDGPDGEVLRLFETKAADWAAKYVQDGPLTGRLASMSAVVSRHAQAGDRVLDLVRHGGTVRARMPGLRVPYVTSLR